MSHPGSLTSLCKGLDHELYRTDSCELSYHAATVAQIDLHQSKLYFLAIN